MVVEGRGQNIAFMRNNKKSLHFYKKLTFNTFCKKEICSCTKEHPLYINLQVLPVSLLHVQKQTEQY
jgi:hypothetical protein